CRPALKAIPSIYSYAERGLSRSKRSSVTLNGRWRREVPFTATALPVSKLSMRAIQLPTLANRDKQVVVPVPSIQPSNGVNTLVGNVKNALTGTFHGAGWFIVMEAVTTLLIFFFPVIVTWLPNRMAMG
ncbi:hypothetical protein, partial [Stutzerimonas stutzeri]|uniref:hypothetical protein n=1 Tax=Stutzerimonas stutzeri TaxID=316 RepID=UPI00210E601A